MKAQEVLFIQEQIPAAEVAARAPENLEEYGKAPAPAPSFNPASKGTSIVEIAEKLAAKHDPEGTRTVLVRFLFEGSQPDQRKDKPGQKPWMASSALRSAWGVPGSALGDWAVCLVSKHVIDVRINVDISEVTEAQCPAIHRLNGPALVALGKRNEKGTRAHGVAQGGRIDPADILAVVQKAIKIDMSKLAAVGQACDKMTTEIVGLDGLIQGKQSMLTQKNANTAKLQREIDELTAKREKVVASMTEKLSSLTAPG